jgi:hypothetical protein
MSCYRTADVQAAGAPAGRPRSALMPPDRYPTRRHEAIRTRTGAWERGAHRMTVRLCTWTNANGRFRPLVQQEQDKSLAYGISPAC